jgi:hypothetical protein
MKITCSLLGCDAMEISNLTFTISTNNEQYSRSVQYKVIPGHLAMVQFLVGSRIFPAFYSLGTGGSFHGAKCPKHNWDHSLPSRAEVRNIWSFTSTPSGIFKALCSWIRPNLPHLPLYRVYTKEWCGFKC